MNVNVKNFVGSFYYRYWIVKNMQNCSPKTSKPKILCLPPLHKISRHRTQILAWMILTITKEYFAKIYRNSIHRFWSLFVEKISLSCRVPILNVIRRESRSDEFCQFFILYLHIERETLYNFHKFLRPSCLTLFKYFFFRWFNGVGPGGFCRPLPINGW